MISRIGIRRLTCLSLVIGATFAIVITNVTAGQRAVKGEAPPAHLISELRSKNASVRRDAANQLGGVRARGAVRALVEALSDKDAGVREAAAFALGQITDPAATALLIPLLADADSEVRSSSAFALGMIGDRKALQALSYATGDPAPEVRSSAIVALGLMQDAGGVDEILDALDDPSYDVRYDAVWALGQIAEPDAEEQLRGSQLTMDLIKTDESWREAYRQALQNSLESLRTEAHARMSEGTQTRARRATGVVRDNRYANTTRALAVKELVPAAMTERAGKANVSGAVKLRVLVGADGRAVRAYVTKRLGHGLDQRAVEAILQYKFDPELRAGLPQTTWIDLEVKF